MERSSKYVVVAGSGPSFTEIDYSKLPKNFDVFRANSFNFEDKYYLGKKVKAYFFNRPLEQYYTAKLLHQRGEYEIENMLFTYHAAYMATYIQDFLGKINNEMGGGIFPRCFKNN